MRTFQQVGPLRTYLRGIRAEGKTIGFVPTMGALHDGHKGLIQRAKGDCDLVVTSAYVNPAQFAANEDFDRYPRDMNADQAIASNAGADAFFMPSTDEMYPAGFQTVVDVPDMGAVLEGAHRPTHFRGVVTVVTKLLNIVQPDRIYFGQKDYQQLIIIEHLVRDLNIQSAVILVPTVRESDGLAMSSRNAYLSEQEREAAAILYRALILADEMVKNGVTSADEVKRDVERLISSEPLASIDYVALINPDTLQEVHSLADGVALVALAVRIGKTRLIDNWFVAPAGIPISKNRLSSQSRAK